MEIISSELTNIIKLPRDINKIIKNKKYCFFDIETTGFSRFKSKVMLIGILFPTPNGSKIIQFFANNLNNEKELLIKFISFINNFDFLISFNGDTFDIPFLNSRLKFNSIDYVLSKDNNIDFLKVVRKNKNILDLNNCKLKTVEQELGINRKDMIDGKESIDLYYKYTKTKDNALKSIILGHNYDDIYYLPKLLNIYDLIQSKSYVYYSYLIDNKEIKFDMDIREIKLKEEKLNIKGRSNIININKQIYYKDNYSFNWDSSSGLYSLDIAVERGKLSSGKYCDYIDQNKYDLHLNIKDTTNYNLPDNLIIVKDDKRLVNKNIKNIFKSFIHQILNKLYIE